jgi:ankyrin repeat protein
MREPSRSSHVSSLSPYPLPASGRAVSSNVLLLRHSVSLCKMSELVSAMPNFAEKHPQLIRDLGPRSLTNNTPEPRDASGETQDGHTQEEAGSTAKDDISPYTNTSFEHVDVECDLLSSAPRPHPAYGTLGHDCIRLLRILPTSSTAEIRCQLDEFTLHETLAYTALSYTWGSQHGVHRIYVNGHPLLVPKNLWRFLNHARGLAKDLSGWIWCDMLSINQVDLAERGHQVKLMSRIFKTAQTVVVWLGPAYRGSDTAVTALSRLPNGEGFAKQASQLWAGNAGHAMDGMCRRHYWRRLWVFQEIWLAQNIRLMCGSKTAPWSHFHALMEYAHARSGISQLDDNTEVVAKSPAMRMMNLKIEPVDTVLWSLVQGTRHLRCFDTRDKIYALLGVATKGHESIEPDYSMPVPSLLNRLLQEIWSDSPPETFEKAAEWCAKVEDVFGLERGTIFSMQGQRGRYSAPSNDEMRSCRLGPKSSDFTLWWTAFYGHSSVQTLLQKSWTISHFDEDLSKQSESRRDASSTSTPVVSLFQFLRKDMDSRGSFLGLEDVHARLKPEVPMTDAEATDIDACMAWVPLYLTDAVYRNDGHVTRLMLDIGVSCGLLYTRYRPIATLIKTTVDALRSAISGNDANLLKTIFALAGPFVFDADGFVMEMLDHGRTLDKCGLLLELGLMNMVQSSQRGALLDLALSKALIDENDEAVEALLNTDECDPNHFISGRPALFHCMYHLQLKHFRALLNTGKCDLNLADPSSGVTPLMQAARQGLPVYARALIETGACQLNDKNASDGMTPLLYAASRGHKGVVRELLADNRCEVDTPHQFGKTALDMAAETYHHGVVEILLSDSRQKSNVPDVYRNKALSSAAATLHGLNRVRKILSNIQPSSLPGLPSPHSPLWLETKLSLTELMACKHCGRGVNPPCGNCQHIVARIATDRTHFNIVITALRREYSIVRKALGRAFDQRDHGFVSAVSARARGDLEPWNHAGMTMLMLAAARSPNYHSIVDALLKTESWIINNEDNDGWTALIHAGYYGNTGHVESLLSVKWCSIDQPLRMGYPTTVLHMAAYLDRPSFLHRLLGQNGLNLRVQNHLGQTPLIVATTKSRRDNVKLLLSYKTGCGADIRSTQGNTALSLAVLVGDYEMVCLLLNSRQVKDLAHKSGKHLSLIARERGNTDIESVLSDRADAIRI